ncbi:aspartate/glutamate racemase family protein [Brevibacterium sp. 50QC2O2]|jgi:allantoin racemase|uniref:aspartate/glutamate racemase family protein n=1 Tax=Brevibacterium sp. 50QC2O2 TaxID=2968459 RepID=UPI00211BC37A|nr:aspartate/glutamate racemase family protein [Brevibacterium sp. 50QC2O2]MCQ9388130.1 aspartate/glutamate racemase family protein [Brevibacterium sp. 50QC2O2]
MRLLVVNCNTSAATSAAIAAGARAVAAQDVEVRVVEPDWGVESAEGYYDSFISAAAVLDVLGVHGDDYDAVIMAGFGEHGREGARQLLRAPVVDITEAAVMAAQLLGRKYGIVTTLAPTLGGIEDTLLTTGQLQRCVGIRAARIPVLEAHGDPESTAARLAVEAEPLIAAGADVIVLGCAGMAGLDTALESLLGLPVVDGVAAAVGFAEALVRMGKQTSKAGVYTPPHATKLRPSWPVSSRLGGPAPLSV